MGMLGMSSRGSRTGKAAFNISGCVQMLRRERFGRHALGVFGPASPAARRTGLANMSLGRDRPRRFILPMTALRVTPISRAIWLQVSPASKQRLRRSTRSELQVAAFASMLIALRCDDRTPTSGATGCTLTQQD